MIESKLKIAIPISCLQTHHVVVITNQELRIVNTNALIQCYLERGSFRYYVVRYIAKTGYARVSLYSSYS